MSLTREQRAEIRALAAEGHRWQVLMDMFGVSRAMIANLTTQPPTDEEMRVAEGRLAELREEAWLAEDAFGCYRQDAAVLMRSLLEDSPFGPPKRLVSRDGDAAVTLSAK